MHRLRDAGALDDAIANLFVPEVGEDALDVTEVLGLDLCRGPVEVLVPRVDVLRGVEERPANVVGIDDVRRLDDRRQRHAPVGDVQVVVGADAAVDAQQQADDAEITAMIVRQARSDVVRQQPPRHRRHEGAEHLVEGAEAAFHHEAAHPF